MKKGSQTSIKIGLFGGTFNPVHLGHLRAAEEISEAYSLSKTIFIPAHIPPHKRSNVTSAEHRFEMVRLSIQGNSCFEVSDVELKRQGSSYSFETIDYFKNYFDHKADLFFIIGIDAFREINSWKHYPHFFSACNFIVMDRPLKERASQNLIPADIAEDFTYDSMQQCYEHRSGHRVFFCNITLLDISSTAIRKALHEGRSVKYLVPEAVERYIRENKLNLL